MSGEGDSFTALVHETSALLMGLIVLGFAPGELVVDTSTVLNADPPGVFAIVTVTRGKTSYVVAVGRLRDDAAAERWLRAWNAFCALPASPERATRIVRTTEVLKREADIVLALTEAGFELKGQTLQ